MKQFRILVGLAGLVLAGVIGCSSGAELAAIVPSDGSVDSKAAPEAKSGATDGTVTPTDPAPSSPSKTPDPTPSDPSTPPALPTPPKVPETPVTSPSTPIILYIPPFASPLSTPAVVTGVSVGDPVSVDSSESAGTGTGASATFRCGPNEVVTGFEYSHEDVDTGCGDGWSSGCGPEIHMAALKITCSPLTLAGTDTASSNAASVWPTGVTVAGKSDAVMNSDPSATNCKAGVGIATGIVGRVDGELESFGLSCYHFHAWKEGVALLPTYNHTTTCDDASGSDYEYGCSPGYGGAPFEKSCDTNQALVGVTVKLSENRVLGITALQCGDVKPVTMKPIFGGSL